jgi:exopolyphosphatase / guanosine-5'-triphosphate,3'-diphosphate pyrophosphatase
VIGVHPRPSDDDATLLEPMDVAIVDIGSNTARLLVASVDAGGAIEQLRRERHYLRLGDDVHELGRIGPEKLAETAKVAKRFAKMARKSGVERVETIVTAPGRQAANGDGLVRVLSEATGARVVVLTGEDEGRLAWEGAVARMTDPPEVVAVADLGGGSCELAVGTPGLGPVWLRSLDVGALRVTNAYLGGNPPPRELVERAREKLHELLAPFDPPSPDAALVVGGTARAISRLIGRRYGLSELEALTEKLTNVPAEIVTASHGMTADRARTLLGGTLVLAEIARRLGSGLEVGRGGLREGAALALARQRAALAS